ncbi:MAG: hypothetical protein Q9183_007888, partial [Haloplaca sp. 2 TL-2023]
HHPQLTTIDTRISNRPNRNSNHRQWTYENLKRLTINLPMPILTSHILIGKLLAENRRRVREEKPWSTLKDFGTEVVNIGVGRGRCGCFGEVAAEDRVNGVHGPESLVLECGGVEIEDVFDTDDWRCAVITELDVFGEYVSESLEVFGV